MANRQTHIAAAEHLLNRAERDRRDLNLAAVNTRGLMGRRPDAAEQFRQSDIALMLQAANVHAQLALAIPDEFVPEPVEPEPEEDRDPPASVDPLGDVLAAADAISQIVSAVSKMRR